MNARLWKSPWSYSSIYHIFDDWLSFWYLVSLSELQKFVKRVFFDKFGTGFLIPGWKRAFTNHVEPDFGACHGREGPSGGRNDRRIWIFLICLHNHRSRQQSYQMCQRKILRLFDKNRPSKPNFEPQFIIRMTSNRGHYLWKVTPNLPMYRMYPADLCTKIFNGI